MGMWVSPKGITKRYYQKVLPKGITKRYHQKVLPDRQGSTASSFAASTKEAVINRLSLLNSVAVRVYISYVFKKECIYLLSIPFILIIIIMNKEK
jgi:hypothetical protein